jgi:hypothetical protein
VTIIKTASEPMFGADSHADRGVGIDEGHQAQGPARTVRRRPVWGATRVPASMARSGRTRRMSRPPIRMPGTTPEPPFRRQTVELLGDVQRVAPNRVGRARSCQFWATFRTKR